MPKIEAETATGLVETDAPAGKKLVLAIEDAGVDILHRCPLATRWLNGWSRGRPQRLQRSWNVGEKSVNLPISHSSRPRKGVPGSLITFPAPNE